MNQRENKPDRVKQAKIFQMRKKNRGIRSKQWIVTAVITSIALCILVGFCIYSFRSEGDLAAFNNLTAGEPPATLQDSFPGAGDSENSEATEVSHPIGTAAGGVDTAPETKPFDGSSGEDQINPAEKPVTSEEQPTSQNHEETIGTKSPATSVKQSDGSGGQNTGSTTGVQMEKGGAVTSDMSAARAETELQEMGLTIRDYNSVASKAAAVKVNSTMLSMSGLSAEVNAVKSAQATLNEGVNTYGNLVSSVHAQDIPPAGRDQINAAGKEVTRLKAELDRKVADLKAAKKDMNFDKVSALMQEIAKNFEAAGLQIEVINTVLEAL